MEEEVQEKRNDMFLDHGSFISLDEQDFHFKALEPHFQLAHDVHHMCEEQREIVGWQTYENHYDILEF